MYTEFTGVETASSWETCCLSHSEKQTLISTIFIVVLHLTIHLSFFSSGYQQPASSLFSSMAWCNVRRQYHQKSFYKPWHQFIVIARVKKSGSFKFQRQYLLRQNIWLKNTLCHTQGQHVYQFAQLCFNTE